MTAPVGTSPQSLEDQVKQAELQVRLATAEASIRDLKADKQLPTIPDLTDRTPTVSDNGGAAAASLASVDVVASKAQQVAIAVRGVTKQGDTIVLLGDATVAPRLGAAYEIRARTRSLNLAVKILDRCKWDVDLPILGETKARPTGGKAGLAAGAVPGEGATAAVSAPPAAQALTLAVDLLDAMSPRVTLSGRELPTTSTALRAKIAGELASGADEACRSVITPDQATVLTSCSFREANDLALRVDALRGNVLGAQARLAPFATRLEALRAERDLAYKRLLDAVADGKAGEAALRAEVKRLEDAIQSIQEIPGYIDLSALASRAAVLITAIDTFLFTITTRVEGVSPLQAAALAELLTGDLDLGDDLTIKQPTDRYLLDAEVVMAAGDVLTTTSLFETSIKASGAAQVIYRLTDLSGKVVASGEQHGVADKELIDDKLHRFRKWATLAVVLVLIIAISIAVIVLLLSLMT